MISPVPILANVATMPNNAAVNYYPLNPASAGSTWGTARTAMYWIFKYPVELSSFVVNVEDLPGAAKTWTFNIMKNDVATSLEATVDNSDKTARCTAGTTVKFNAGDTACLRCTPAGGPATMTNLRFGFIMDTLGNQLLQGFNGYNGTGTVGTVYSPLFRGALASAALGNIVDNYCPIDMTISEWHVTLRDAPGAGKSSSFTIDINGVASAATVTLSDAETTKSITGLSVVVAKGDHIVVRQVATNTPTATFRMSTVVFRPKRQGEYPNSTGVLSISRTLTNWLRGCNSYSSANTTAENNTRSILPSNVTTYFRNFYVTAGVAPGAGKSWTGTLRKNMSATGMTNSAVLQDANLQGGDVTSIDSVFGENFISAQIVPAGLPNTTTNIAYSVAHYIPPAVPCML